MRVALCLLAAGMLRLVGSEDVRANDYMPWVYNFYDMIAQTACVSKAASKHTVVWAARRHCGEEICQKICTINRCQVIGNDVNYGTDQLRQPLRATSVGSQWGCLGSYHHACHECSLPNFNSDNRLRCFYGFIVKKTPKILHADSNRDEGVDALGSMFFSQDAGCTHSSGCGPSYCCCEGKIKT